MIWMMHDKFEEMKYYNFIINFPFFLHNYEAEKNMTDEEKEIQKQFQKSVSPPSPSDGEKDGSMTSVQERDRSMT